jgi:hypothetical protein
LRDDAERTGAPGQVRRPGREAGQGRTSRGRDGDYLRCDIPNRSTAAAAGPYVAPGHHLTTDPGARTSIEAAGRAAMDDPSSSSTWWLSADRTWRRGTPPPGWWQASDRRWHPPAATMPITGVTPTPVAAPEPSHQARVVAAHHQPNAVTASTRHPQGTTQARPSRLWARLTAQIRRSSRPLAAPAPPPTRAIGPSHRDQWLLPGVGADRTEWPLVPDNGLAEASTGPKHAKKRS